MTLKELKERLAQIPAEYDDFDVDAMGIHEDSSVFDIEGIYIYEQLRNVTLTERPNNDSPRTDQEAGSSA